MSIPAARVIAGDCRDVLATLESDSVHAIVTDPPAGISFMGKSWDGDKGGRDHWIAWMRDIASECLRVIKPGGHALVWALPRTSHWTATAWENAGWIVRDRVAHIGASGFPKSLNVSVAIDKMAGAEREVVGFDAAKAARQTGKHGTSAYGEFKGNAGNITASATEAARQWAGWGTALKPAVEDWWLLRKPLSEPTVARNVLVHACGALNIDASRIGTQTRTNSSVPRATRNGFVKGFVGGTETVVHAHGRWPANLIHDGSPEVEEAFAAFGEKTSNPGTYRKAAVAGCYSPQRPAGTITSLGDTGTASRFFYCSKAKAHDRAGSKHPTVKPLSLMTYLIKLITPPGGVVLDPFAGSGTTLQAAIEAGFDTIGIEKEPEYVADIRARLAHLLPLFAEAVA